MQAALATFNAAYALFELLNIHAGEYGDCNCDCEWVPARQTPNAIYCVPPTLQSAPPPHAISSLST